jgi:hypothetical protein
VTEAYFIKALCSTCAQPVADRCPDCGAFLCHARACEAFDRCGCSTLFIDDVAVEVDEG